MTLTTQRKSSLRMMMPRALRTISLFPCTIPVALLAGLSGMALPVTLALEKEVPPASPIDLTAVMTAWTERQQRVDSARFVWCPDDSAAHWWSSYQVTWPPDAATNPEITRHESLVLKGDRFRYATNRWYYRSEREFAGYHGPPDDPEVYFPLDEALNRTVRSVFFDALHARFPGNGAQLRSPRHLTRIFDGSSFRELLSAASTQHAEAAIYAGAGGGLPEDLAYRPLLLSLRPLSPLGTPPDTSRWELVANDVYVDGVRCLQLQESADHDVVRSYWIDPRRDFVIVRQIETHGGTPAAQLDIKYEEHERHGWLPANWTVMIMQGSADVEDFPGQHELFPFLAAKVISSTINESVSEDTLTIAFPPGTVVNDMLGGQHYLIQPDGSFMDLSREDVLALKRGEAPEFWRRYSLRTWGLILAFFMFAAAAVIKLRESISARNSGP
ncbi:MAG: hypothetical protein ABGZ35_03205 [Planctomycetaceae bacterium]